MRERKWLPKRSPSSICQFNSLQGKGCAEAPWRGAGPSLSSNPLPKITRFRRKWWFQDKEVNQHFGYIAFQEH